MAGTAQTDLTAVTILANDIAGAPQGFDLLSHKAVVANKIKDAQIAAQQLKNYSTEAATKTAIDIVIASLA